MKTLTAMAVGGAIVYFLDPASGRQRRERAQRTIGSLLNIGQRAAVESGRADVAETLGKVQRVTGTETSTPSRVVVPS